MENAENHDSAMPSEKLPYESPVLQELGDVQDITRMAYVVSVNVN